MPMVLGWSLGGGRFVMGEARLYGSIHSGIRVDIDEGHALSCLSIVGVNAGISWSFLSMMM